MTKQELEQAIKNSESVWAVYGDCIEKDKFFNNEERVMKNVVDFNKLFKTKAEAEHYLHHANITRTEQLPFYTFSEIAKDEKNFKMGKTYTLIEDKNFVLDINKSYVSQIVLYTGKEKYSWNFNEENFYKAYDECVRLFKGE